MRKRNGGFTLIELLIAIAVLSTMAGVLLQGFVVGLRMNQKSRGEEVVQNLAKMTMEEMKGYSFEQIDRKIKDAGAGNTVSIAGMEYRWEPFPSAADGGGGEVPRLAAEERGAEKVKQESEGYRLIREYRKSPESDKADYLIAVDMDWGTYGKEPETETADGTKKETTEDVYSINRYQMPNIADVDSFQNVVIDPEILTKDDLAIEQELRAKAEGKANQGKDNAAEGESGSGENGEDENGADENGEDETEIEVTIGEIKKSLVFEVGESNSGGKDGKLLVKVKAVYSAEVTVTESDGTSSTESSYQETVTVDLKAYKKKIALDEKTGKTLNRIYLFLPKESSIKFTNVDFKWETALIYELFVVAPGEPDAGAGDFGSSFYLNRDDLKINDAPQGDLGQEDPGQEDLGQEAGWRLYTNMAANDMPVSLAEPKRRLYRLTVTVYTAVYEGGTSAEPVPGEEVLKLDSTKSE